MSDTIREARIKLLRTAIDGYLGADLALDALVGEAAAKDKLLRLEQDETRRLHEANADLRELRHAAEREAAAKDKQIEDLEGRIDSARAIWNKVQGYVPIRHRAYMSRELAGVSPAQPAEEYGQHVDPSHDLPMPDVRKPRRLRGASSGGETADG